MRFARDGIESAYAGRLDADGRIVSGSAALLSLHLRCGGGGADPIAAPGLALLVRQAARLNMPLSASTLLADGERNASYWAVATPDNDEIDLRLYEWHGDERVIASPSPENARMRDFIRAASDWTWWVDAAFRIVSLSSSATSIFDQPTMLLVGKRLDEVLDVARLDTDILGRSGFQARTRGTGAARSFRLYGQPLHDDAGRIIGYAGTAVEMDPETADISMAAASSAVREEAFPARAPVGDILKDPIDKITERAEAMQAQQFGHLRSVYAGYAGDIAMAARHLRSLVDDVFDVAAIDSGTVALSIEPVDLTTLAEEARAIVSQRAEAAGTRIIWRVAPQSVIVRADRGRTLQILINLMQNAVKFAGSAGPVRLLLESDDGEARIRVDDEGGGVPAADRERAFRKFERLNPASAEGSGLGLYISRALARVMGGDIALSESPEHGARFTLILTCA